MFQIRRIHDDLLPSNRHSIEQVQLLMRDRFPDVLQADIDGLPGKLRDPLKSKLRSLLWVAEGNHGELRGFAYAKHAQDVGLFWLDFISAVRDGRGGIGAALYQRVRESARQLEVPGIFMECLPDEKDQCSSDAAYKENVARMRFYERFGARPIIGTQWQLPLPNADEGDMPPMLVFDDLGQKTVLHPKETQLIADAILLRKYPKICPPEYRKAVVTSFTEDPIRIRAPRYEVDETIANDILKIPKDERIVLFTHASHNIHHVRERGYVESPARITAIKRELDKTELFLDGKVTHAPEAAILAVHDVEMVRFMKKLSESLDDKKAVYPYVFPIRNAARKPKDLETRVGYYCIDTFTPMSKNAWHAARVAADCAYSAARAVVEGAPMAYALVRPPGHHAEYGTYGGFCYLCNAGIAAHELAKLGPVVMLDIDYHHGNGQQDIFYKRSDVLTLSIHGDPSFAYPYFCGFAEEIGEGEGEGFNVNYPLPETITVERFLKTVQKALKRAMEHKPVALVISLGLDTAKGDPTGTWSLGAADFEAVGKLIGQAKLPTVVVQEGGYDTKVLGTNARRFFTGLWRGHEI